MNKFRLAVGLHNHQPVGNFEHVFEDAHQHAYAPFLEVLRNFPTLRMTLHQSGILWDWQEQHHPEYLETVRGMIRGGRLELLTGGFYEPILTSIPTRDLHGQIAMLTDYLKDRFGVNASGLWLTERVWEPHLPKVLALSGVKFLPVDDTHFIFAGLEHAQLVGPYTTEFEGYTVTLLPIQKRLRYLIPFGTVQEVITELKKQAETSPTGLAVYADDGEKFGVWPNTYKHCYVDGWLEKFFTEVEKNSDWLEMVPLSEAAAMHPIGRVYLPSASYEEMGHWALPAPAFAQYESFENWLKNVHKGDQYTRFVRGGHWRGFLAKYDEVNLMHKKMLAVSDSLARLEENPKLARAAGDIRDRLYASQCNCGYWHGVFGGLYLPHLRQAVYAAMIEAEAKLRELTGTTGLAIQVRDYDADNIEEVVVQTEHFTAVFKPDVGGMLLDLALSKHAFDLTDTLTRRKEGYHSKLTETPVESVHQQGTASIHDVVKVKEKGLERFLIEDWYLKRCFLDHFLPVDTELDEFMRAQVRETGDFILGQYQYETDGAKGQVRMFRDGWVRTGSGDYPVRVVKTFIFEEHAERIQITYELTATGGHEIPCLFAIENNFSFQAGHAPDRYVLIDGQRPEESFLDSVGAHQRTYSVGLVDEWRKLAVLVQSRQECDTWHHPLFTVSLSEAGFEKVYQGTTLVQLYQLTLTERPTVIELTLHAGGMQGVLRNLQAKKAARAH